MDTVRSCVCIGTHHDVDTHEARPYRTSLVLAPDRACSFTWTWLDTGDSLDLEVTPDTPFVEVWTRITQTVTAT